MFLQFTVIDCDCVIQPSWENIHSKGHDYGTKKLKATFTIGPAIFTSNTKQARELGSLFRRSCFCVQQGKGVLVF